MTQFSETELTAAVIRSFDGTPDPRAKFLLQELVKSLHDYVRKTDLTFEEWDYAIDFLTRTGQKCTDTRQEFILLSDVFGVSMLVDAVNHRDRDGATETTVLGPFYVGEHKVTAHGTDISPRNETGEKMFVQSRVTDLKGKPLAGVPVDVWHADGDGESDRREGQDEGVGQHIGDDPRHRPPRQHVSAEIAEQDVAEEGEEALVPGLVQPHLRDEALGIFRRRGRTEQGRRRIAGDERRQGEEQEHRSEHDQDRGRQPAGDVVSRFTHPGQLPFGAATQARAN